MPTHKINADLDVDGEVQGTSLDINGAADISGDLTGCAYKGDVIANAYLDADTAHLSTTQTFTGAKTFTGTVALTGTGRITGIDTVSAGTDAANKTYVDTMLPKAGGTMSGAIAMGNQNITGAGTITGTTLTGTSLDINGNADISGNLTGVDIFTCGGVNEYIGNLNLRNYFLSTGDAGGSFLLGKIEHGANSDGAISATCHFAYDYGTQTNNCTLHFNFSQRSGTARGTWWYEGDDQDGANDRVHARLIDDGSGGMFVWITCVDFAQVYVEARCRLASSVLNSGSLTAATLTSGTTLLILQMTLHQKCSRKTICSW